MIDFGAGLKAYYHALPYYMNMTDQGIRIVSYENSFCSVDVVTNTAFGSTLPTGLCPIGKLLIHPGIL